MNQKQIGVIAIIIGVLFAGFVYFGEAQKIETMDKIIMEQGSCYLEDGTCLHESKQGGFFVFGYVLSAALIILGVYIVFFDKTQKIILETQEKVSSALVEAKEVDEFKAFLSGFPPDEREIISVVHDNEGIKQSTLRYKVGMSKTAVSLILKSLEERDIISRKELGKTKQVFIRKKF
jgi:uncharacterized membrane protein